MRRNQPVELSRYVESDTALTLTGTAVASGGIKSLFYVVDYDYDNVVSLPDSVTFPFSALFKIPTISISSLL